MAQIPTVEYLKRVLSIANNGLETE